MPGTCRSRWRDDQRPGRTRPRPTSASTSDNPVDWLPWGRAALSRARDEDRPLLVSIGYSACHWCHVMERESFEDAETAAADERALRLREGRPRGAPRRRRDLHGGGAGDDRPRRLAAERLPDARPGAVLRRDLLPAGAAAGHAAHGARCSRRSPTHGATGATRSASRATGSPRRLRGGGAAGAGGDELDPGAALDARGRGAARPVRPRCRAAGAARRSSRPRR